MGDLGVLSHVSTSGVNCHLPGCQHVPCISQSFRGHTALHQAALALLRCTGIPSSGGRGSAGQAPCAPRAFHVGGNMPGVSCSAAFQLKILFFRPTHGDTCEKRVILLLSLFPSAWADSPASSSPPRPAPRLRAHNSATFGGDGAPHCFFTHGDDTTSIF